MIGIQSKLRFGIMCDGPHLAEWEHRCVAKVLEIEGVEATLIIVRDELSQIIAGKRANVRGRASKLLWRVYRRYALERSSSAAKLRAFPDYLNRIPILKVGIQKIGKYRQELYHQDINKLREENLDFILQFRSGILSGDVLEVARFGIWSFHHGDPHHYRGRPPGFWERLESRPVTGAILQRLTERLDAGVRLYTGQFKTDMASYVRSLDGLYFGVADWPARVCKDILNGCAAYLNDPPIATSAPITREPSNLQMLRFLAKQAKEWLALHWKSLFRHQQWCVGLVDAPLPSIVRDTGGQLMRNVTWLKNPEGRFLADPFAVEVSGGGENEILLLAEDFDWATERGRISALRNSDLGSSEPELLFQLPVHMSYPYLLRHNNRLFCIPETNGAAEVCLYALDEQKLDWTREAVLITGRRLVDSTVLLHEDRWWLFATEEDNGPNNKLQAWHANELTGPWLEHSGNPLKTDVRSSRPAGRPFLIGHDLYRPAQDCSEIYGGAVAINRILKLTPHEFQEETVNVLRPLSEWHYNAGLHTVCGVGARTVIDACRMTFVPSAFASAFRRKLTAPARKLRTARRRLS